MTCNSRRRFILGSCALAVGATLGHIPLVASTTFGTKRYAMLHDESKCIGCTACMEACRETNRVPAGVSRLEIIRSEPQGTYPDASYRFFRKSCQHCDNPPCVAVCPSGASFRDAETGIVDVNPDKCVGCQYCLAACPYQVRFIHPETKTPDKCDFCRNTNLAEGKLPACVLACPTNALIFGDVNDPDSAISKMLIAKPIYRSKVALGTGPRLYRVSKSSAELLAGGPQGDGS